jgi:hypothetical protein
MANLKTRVTQLEAAAPQSESNLYCKVVHTEDCNHAKAVAIAEFVAKHGHEPKNFIDIILVSPETKQSVCGCRREEVMQ